MTHLRRSRSGPNAVPISRIGSSKSFSLKTEYYAGYICIPQKSTPFCAASVMSCLLAAVTALVPAGTSLPHFGQILFISSLSFLQCRTDAGAKAGCHTVISYCVSKSFCIEALLIEHSDPLSFVSSFPQPEIKQAALCETA